MQTDSSEFINSKETWVYARNAMLNSHNGNVLHLQNEPSNTFCVEFPFIYIGSVKLKNNRYVVFLTDDNINSEIGVVDTTNCTYTKIVNDECLNFSTSHPIFATSKENSEGEEEIYFCDGQLNEIRKLNISKIPYKFNIDNDNCQTKIYTDELDCNALSFSFDFTIPKINIKSRELGNLKNGTYQATIAYSSNKQRITDYFSVTSPTPVWSQRNNNGSISLEIENLDRSFNEYILVIIATIENQTFYKIIGEFPTTTTTHSINTLNSPSYVDIPLEEITIKKTYYQKADYLTSNNQHLFLKGLSTRPKLNYQQKALNIISKYVVYQAPIDYYLKGNNVGYYRDETYAFLIQWLFTDGEWSDEFHIAGRKATSTDLQIISNDDSFTSDGCNEYSNYRYEVYNTASSLNTPYVELNDCEIKYIGEGTMGYHQSEENYPDNEYLFGDDKCSPIRHHKFPSEKQVSRYSTNGKDRHINILGVKFENIEKPDNPNVVGYRILRGDRYGNKTVVARGMMSNNRFAVDYSTSKWTEYTNYPFNNSQSDKFLNQVDIIDSPNTVSLPTNIYNNRFNLFAPHCFIDRVGAGDYIKLECVEKGVIDHYFELVKNHPKHKLITNSVLIYAATIGMIDAFIRINYGTKISVEFKDNIVISSAPQNIWNTQQSNSLLDGIRNILDQKVQLLSSNPADIAWNVIKPVLEGILTALQGTAYVIYAVETAQKVIDIVYNVIPYTQYAIQNNNICNFNSKDNYTEGNHRRKIKHYQYLNEGLNNINQPGSFEFNNVYKKDNVFVSIDGSLPIYGDDSQLTLGSTSDQKLNKLYNKEGKLLYTSIKRSLPKQYGQLDSFKTLSLGKHTLIDENTPQFFNSEDYFGGDCFINRFTVNNPVNFFSNLLYNQPDGYELDYRTVKSIINPRYWADFTKYDVISFIGSLPTLISPSPSINIPSSKHELDGNVIIPNVSRINKKYFYSSVNSVMDYIVESDYNLDTRNFTTDRATFFSQNSNLSNLFEHKGVLTNEEFLYDKSFSKQLLEDIFYQQPLDFNGNNYTNYQPNKTIYSLPSFKEQRYDNWTVFLPNNMFDFSLSQFGNLTSIKQVDNQQLLFLFDKSFPYITPGLAELKTLDNRTIYLGDGSLIRNPVPLLITDDNFGSCESRFAFNYTKYGFFYPSQSKGNIFQFNGTTPEEISRNGMYYFFNNHLPSKLLKHFPEFKYKDNPIIGTSLISAYDSTNETYYITKKDYEPKKGLNIIYNKTEDKFYHNDKIVSLFDKNYFNDVSYTISYSPSIKGFVSFHDYHPISYIANDNTFYSVIKDNNKSSLWLHNKNCQSFSNFYNKDYPFAATLPINNQINTQILNSIEFFAETFVYNEDCINYHHVLNETFDKALVYNTEQCSGFMNLKTKSKNNTYEKLLYNKKVLNSQGIYDVYLDKVEQKYRFNNFRDIVIDRNTSIPIINFENNGYKFDLNPLKIDYELKQPTQKFRHIHSNLYLEKTISNNKKIMLYLINVMQNNSPR